MNGFVSFLKSFVRKTISSIIKLKSKINKKVNQSKKICLVCGSQTMVYHIERFLDSMKGEEKIVYFLCCSYSGYSYFKNIRKASELRKNWKDYRISLSILPYYLGAWDLIVSPDYIHSRILYMTEIPFFYINHGSHIICLDGTDELYAYSGKYAIEGIHNRPIATKIFEGNKYLAELYQKDPVWNNIVEFVGSKDVQLLENALEKRSEYRNKFKLEEDETFVVVFGSWREDSLFHYLDHRFIETMKSLMNKKYKFALSIHPQEYLSKKQYQLLTSGEPLGEYVDSLDKEGFIIRKPTENYIPYLIAADIVVCDYSAMSELAILARRKVILSYFPDKLVSKNSMIGRMKKSIPILLKDSNFEEIFVEVSSNPINPVQDLYRQEMVLDKSDYETKVKEIVIDLLGI